MEPLSGLALPLIETLLLPGKMDLVVVDYLTWRWNTDPGVPPWAGYQS